MYDLGVSFPKEEVIDNFPDEFKKSKLIFQCSIVKLRCGIRAIAISDKREPCSGKYESDTDSIFLVWDKSGKVGGCIRLCCYDDELYYMDEGDYATKMSALDVVSIETIDSCYYAFAELTNPKEITYQFNR